MLRWLLNIKNGWYYLFLIVMSAIFVYFSNYFLTEILVYNVLGEQYTALQIQKILAEMTKWQPLGYLIIPLIFIIRPLFTAFCLQAGSLFQEYNWKWKNIFNISIIAKTICAKIQNNLYKKKTYSTNKSFFYLIVTHHPFFLSPARFRFTR